MISEEDPETPNLTKSDRMDQRRASGTALAVEKQMNGTIRSALGFDYIRDPRDADRADPVRDVPRMGGQQPKK